jgi:hypothetical protein
MTEPKPIKIKKAKFSEFVEFYQKPSGDAKPIMSIGSRNIDNFINEVHGSAVKINNFIIINNETYVPMTSVAWFTVLSE